MEAVIKTSTMKNYLFRIAIVVFLIGCTNTKPNDGLVKHTFSYQSTTAKEVSIAANFSSSSIVGLCEHATNAKTKVPNNISFIVFIVNVFCSFRTDR